MSDNIQLAHKDHQPSAKKFALSIIANDINSPVNVGSLFRLSDAMGIEKLYLCGDTPAPPNSKINKTSRSTEKYVAHETHSDAEELVRQLKSSGVFIISLEITSSSIAIDSEQFKQRINAKQPICLILGSENTGVKPALLELSDLTAHVTMYGNNSSMNVVTATGIACYEITSKL